MVGQHRQHTERLETWQKPYLARNRRSNVRRKGDRGVRVEYKTTVQSSACPARFIVRGYGYTVDTQHWLARSFVHLAHDPTPQTALSIPERVRVAATLLPEVARNPMQEVLGM